MSTIQLGNIKVQYDESVTDIDTIAKIIKSNQYLFTDYQNKIISIGLPTLNKNKNTVYISNFYNFFDDLLKMILTDNRIISSLDHPDLLPALYIQLLAKKEAKKGSASVLLDNNISDDTLWFMIACKYFDYKTNFDALSNFLKYQHESDSILSWLKETQRYQTYNYLLKIVSTYLKENDVSFFDNINEIILKMTNENLSFASSSSKESNYNFPKISLETFDNLFLGFLNNINAPDHWKKTYTILKKENRILFEESCDGINHSEVFEDENGIKKIRVTIDGTIKYFISFVHEFIHYMSSQENIPFSLLEFPPIYFERIAAYYLICIGYEENIIKQVINNRNQNNFDIYSSLCGILIDIGRYNTKGPITKEEIVEPLEKTMASIYKARKDIAKICEESGKPIENSDFLTMPTYNWGELVDKNCDENIMNFIKNDLFILNGYQYLIGSYLTNSILEKQDRNKTLEKMIFITEHLADFTIEKVIDYLEMNNAFAPSSRKLK